MPTTNNNFFVYIGDNWEQINPDFTNEVEYLQQLIVILNNKIDKLTDNLEAVNSYTEIKNKIINLLKEKLRLQFYNYPFPNDCYELGKLASMVTNGLSVYTTYYLDNINGNDNNDGLTILTPRKTLPNTLDSSKTRNATFVIRLLDSTEPYYIEDIINPINDAEQVSCLIGNYFDPTQVKIESKTQNYTEITKDYFGIANITISNDLYLTGNNIMFSDTPISNNLYIQNGTSSIIKRIDDNTTTDDTEAVAKIVLGENATINNNQYTPRMNSIVGYYQAREVKDFQPLPSNTQISNLEELNKIIDYLKKAINVDNANIEELIKNITEPNIYLDGEILTIDDDLKNTGTYSIRNLPITTTDYDTNETIKTWDRYTYVSVTVDAGTEPRNIKVKLGDIWETIYELIKSTNYIASTFRTLLNNNKTNGTDMPSSTNTYGTAYATGGTYQIPLSTDFKIENKGTQFNIANTDTAEFRFGYDNNDNNTQNYIQMLMTEDTITFNEVNGATTTPLTTFTLPDTTTTSKVIKWSLYARKDKTLNIVFNDETYETTLKQAISNPYWYINIPSNSTSLRRVTGTTAAQGITITEYPTRII